MLRAFLFSCMIAISTGASATEPCMEISKQEFEKRVLDKSDLIVYGEITGYSNDNDTADQWTKVKVLDVLYSAKNESPKKIKIEGWQANFFPLYVYEKGNKVVFFLNGNKLTDNEWKACNPSDWGNLYNRYQLVETKEKNSEISVEELKNTIQQYYKK